MGRAFLLLACLALAPGARAAAEDDATFVDLVGCTVLASPGTPEGLHPFLPGGVAPRPLTWPLPDGPVLVLGLPQSDAAARDLAFFWDLLAPGENLHGGYLIAAWHDGTRPMAVILADDAAALYAARFELESAPAPRGMPANALDFTKPPAETGLRIQKGRRLACPVFRQRAFFPGRVTPEAVTTAVAGRANRFWIDAEREEGPVDPLPRLVRHGVVACILLRTWHGDEPQDLARRAEPWIRRGVRHLVLQSASGIDVSAGHLGRQVAHLRSTFELDEVVVFDRTIRVPGTIGSWHPGPSRGPETTTHARTALASAGGPLLLVEAWAHTSRTPVPSQPRGRLAALGRLFEGIVVLDGPGATGVLEDAWTPADRGAEEWESVLLPLLPRRALEPRAFLDRAAVRLAGLDAPTCRAIGWVDPLLGRIRSDAENLPARAVLVPRAPTTVRPDGRLDEPAWTYAATLALPLPDDPRGREATLLAVADGRDLHLALRLPPDARPLQLVLSTSALEPVPGCRIGDADAPQAGARTWERTFGHFELAGDAHPTRVFYVWHVPPAGAPKRVAALVLGP